MARNCSSAHLARWRGLSYPATCREIAALLGSPELQGAPLVIDATGVGRAVKDGLQEAIPATAIIGVSVSSGSAVSSKGNGTFGVPKIDLVDSCRVALETGKLKIAKALELADVLAAELIAFKVRVTKAANETFGAASGTHDDLLFATALAAWFLGTATPAYDGPLVLHTPSGRACHWPGDSPEPRPEPPADKWSALRDLGIDLQEDWPEDAGWR